MTFYLGTSFLPKYGQFSIPKPISFRIFRLGSQVKYQIASTWVTEQACLIRFATMALFHHLRGAAEGGVRGPKLGFFFNCGQHCRTRQNFFVCLTYCVQCTKSPPYEYIKGSEVHNHRTYTFFTYTVADVEQGLARVLAQMWSILTTQHTYYELWCQVRIKYYKHCYYEY